MNLARRFCARPESNLFDPEFDGYRQTVSGDVVLEVRFADGSFASVTSDSNNWEPRELTDRLGEIDKPRLRFDRSEIAYAIAEAESDGNERRAAEFRRFLETYFAQ